MEEQDRAHLRQAIDVAARARAHGNHPFGAVLVAPDGHVVAEAENSVVTDDDPTGHAETNLVRLAGRLVRGDDLAGHTLFSSCEPCAMCSAAIFWAGIGRVAYALSNEALIAMLPDTDDPALGLSCREVMAAGNRDISVEGPFLEDEAALPHEGFWG